MTPTTMNAPEVRRPTLDLPTQALVDDSRVREIDQTVRESWSELAAISIRVRDKRLWKLLPGKYHSFDDWLMDAAPCCRATVYKGMGVLSVLAKDVAAEDIAQLEIGNAILLAQVSPSVRRDPEVLEAAKSGRHSKTLRETIKRKHPSQLIENVVERKFKFTESQAAIVEEAIEAHRTMNNPSTSSEEIIEMLCAEYLDAPWEDSGYSNRQRAKQIETSQA